ncbi:MAG: hypothetical protein AO394_03230 [Candidatus Fermentibacter daniensis]|nr:MAG: hypothetical protein AO394_03230 [Candidatus Fermentibacter daniensis]
MRNILWSCFFWYSPEKQMSIRPVTGREPALCELNGPPSLALFVSIILPLRIALTLTPLPRCSTTMFRSRSGLPSSRAAL